MCKSACFPLHVLLRVLKEREKAIDLLDEGNTQVFPNGSIWEKPE